MNIYYFIKRHFKAFFRACSYFKIGYNNHDWDYGCLHDLTLFKLKRMKTFFIEEGYHWEGCENFQTKKMKSLNLAIKLLEKYRDYDNKFMNFHSKKWGERIVTYIKIEGSENCYIEVSRPRAVVIEEIKQEKKELISAYEADFRTKQRFLNNAYKIIGKYSHYWWD